MAGGINENDLVEQPAMALLEQLGWQTVSAFDETLGPDGTLGRDSQGDVILTQRLHDALRAINPGVPDTALAQAIERITENRMAMDRVRANAEIYALLRDGTKVTVDRDGKRETVTVRYVDWDHADTNDYLAASQVWVTGEMYRRRADIVLFVNGIPLVLVELKVSHRNVRAAYDENLRDYRDTIRHVFDPNAFVVLSNGADTLVGSTYAPWEHFAEWKKVDSEGEPGVVSLETALRGTCEPHRLLDLVENFVAYSESRDGLIKKLARYHQYLGVNNAIEALHAARAAESHQLGVFWHTQGSGKSLSNLWFTRKVLRKVPGKWTFVEVTDRKELDDQLYDDFVDTGVITAGDAVHAETAAHLRELLVADHRYVFTLIHKFIPPTAGESMPVLSERDDIIVITDEAHRSQYDTLAWNMRAALPNASFLGFTGTPLIAGEEQRTRQVFGDYVSIYNFADSIADGATVPLYYENRIPELQLTNDDFDAELATLLDDADLDDDAHRAVERQFARQYHLITRTARLERIAADLVEHFLARGFRGKAMYVAIDKATALRMYDLVAVEWAKRISALETRLDGLDASADPAEHARLEAELAYLRASDRAVVVSQAQNEIADMADAGLDIAPHRARMNTEKLDERFKDPDDPLRLVFVCAMWLTGFDAPATSTIYLDKPMRNHTLMQTIARANRVFADKDGGLIVDYVGVFANLEAALAIYGASGTAGGDTPIRAKSELAAELAAALGEAATLLAANDVDLDDLCQASGFEFIALQTAATEALLVDDATRRGYVAVARRVRDAFKTLLPDETARRETHRVAVIGSLAAKLMSATEAPDISGVMDAVAQLLDRSVGVEEYVIRAGGAQSSIIDLNTLDFDALARRFGANKRTAANHAKANLARRLDDAVRKNPTRLGLAEKFRRLIDAYNAGTHNLDEFLRRLREINDELTAEEQRAVTEELSEAELAIYDLLTKPEPELTANEKRKVKAAARHLLERIADALVLDWRKRQHSRAKVHAAVQDVLDAELPDVYGPDLFDDKVQQVYEHLYASYFDDGGSVYTISDVAVPTGEAGTGGLGVIEAVRADPELLAKLAEEVFGANATWAIPTAQLLVEENRYVEFKQSARWSLRSSDPEVRRSEAEEIIAKTVAGFLNAQGGTLLIGVRDRPVEAVGLDADYTCVKPRNADGFVNWLDTMLQNNLGHAGAHRVVTSIDVVEGHDVCRVDVPASSKPIWATFKGQGRVLFERRNNSTRRVPDDAVDAFLAERFGAV